MDAAVVIRPFRDSDLDAVVELSLRAWEPVFESLRAVLGDAIFARLHQPEWRTVQAEAVRSTCRSEERDVFVAVADGKPVGFATVALDAFHERMGVVDMIAVDPACQRRGIATALMDRSADHMRAPEPTARIDGRGALQRRLRVPLQPVRCHLATDHFTPRQGSMG